MHPWIFERMTSFISALILFTLGLALINNTSDTWQDQLDTRKLEIAQLQSKAIEQQIQRSLAGAATLAAHIHSLNGSDHDFLEFSENIHRSLDPHTRILIAPKGIVTQQYPATPAGPSLHHFMENPQTRAEALLAISSNKMTAAAPVSIDGSNNTIVGISPIFTHSDTYLSTQDPATEIKSGTHFWGFAAAVIDLQNLLQSTELNALNSKGFGYKLWRLSLATNSEQVIAGDPDSDRYQGTRTSIRLPNNYWFLDVFHRGSGIPMEVVSGFYLANLLFSALAGYLLYVQLIRPKELKAQVLQSTKKLTQQSLQLENQNRQLINDQLELKKLTNAVEQSGNSTFITDTKGIIQYANPRFCEVTGFNLAELLGNTPRLIKSPFTTDKQHALLWQTIKKGERWYGEIRNQRKDGELYWSLMSVSPIFDDEGVINSYVCVSDDITSNKETQLRYQRLALEDPLTRLSNRRHFMQQVDHFLLEISRHNRLGAVFYIDLDNFKPINDQFGHDTGDAVLQFVAHIITTSVRKSDVTARLGGDEFTLLLTDVNSLEEVLHIADKLLKGLTQTTNIEGNMVDISASIGISLINNGCESSRQILHQADSALYRSKKTGRGNYSLYSHDDDHRTIPDEKKETEELTD
ncbi:MAG: diguanylate cyclase [Motiliproteus sp.]